jgi:hypothetical protein
MAQENNDRANHAQSYNEQGAQNGAVKVFFHLEQDNDGYPPVAAESVWAARTKNDGEFVLDNIPFFVSEATFGDAVSAQESDGALWFDQLINWSGNSLIRVVFFDKSIVAEVRDFLSKNGCSSEYSAAFNLLAINVPPDASLVEIEGFLHAKIAEGAIDCEWAILRDL